MIKKGSVLITYRTFSVPRTQGDEPQRNVLTDNDKSQNLDFIKLS